MTAAFRVLRIPFVVGFKHAAAERHETSSVWVEARHEHGAVGFGEGCPAPVRDRRDGRVGDGLSAPVRRRGHHGRSATWRGCARGWRVTRWRSTRTRPPGAPSSWRSSMRWRGPARAPWTRCSIARRSRLHTATPLSLAMPKAKRLPPWRTPMRRRVFATSRSRCRGIANATPRSSRPWRRSTRVQPAFDWTPTTCGAMRRTPSRR